MNGKNATYQCIFFDLDHTLWDYETNSRQTLDELYERYDLYAAGIPDKHLFFNQFRKVNLELWDLYDRELVNHDYIRIERFKQILQHFNAYDERLSTDISIEYLRTCPTKGNLMPYAKEVLNYLSDKYQLTVVTNGFDEIQNIKLCSSGIDGYFDHVVTSQKAGSRKPSAGIFQYALEANKIAHKDVIMIGDNLVTDIGGARASAIDSIFFNPEKLAFSAPVDREISCLSELQNIL